MLSFIYNIVGLDFAVRSILSPIVAAILKSASSVSVVTFVSLMVAIIVHKKNEIMSKICMPKYVLLFIVEFLLYLYLLNHQIDEL